MNNFYVYAFYYPWNNEIFYVGKGINQRIITSSRLSKHPRDKNHFKQQALRRIYNSGYVPIRKKLYENISEEVALEIEENLIKQYGRICDGSGILTNIAKSSKKGNTGWTPSIETRKIWSKQRKGVKQSKKHIQLRVEKLEGKSRSEIQRYSMIVKKLELCPTIRANYKKILELFYTGKFIESIYKETQIDKEIISRVIKKSLIYSAAINNDPFSQELLNSELKWSCQKISHILKEKKFYEEFFILEENGVCLEEIKDKLDTNFTRIRYVLKNKETIKEIIKSYE